MTDGSDGVAEIVDLVRVARTAVLNAHWLLVRLLRRHGASIDRAAARAVLDAHLTQANLAAEARSWSRTRRSSRTHWLGTFAMLALEPAG